MPAEITVTPRKYAAMWGMHVNSVYYWIKIGAIHAYKYKIFQRYRYQIPINQPVPALKGGPKSAISLPKLLQNVNVSLPNRGR